MTLLYDGIALRLRDPDVGTIQASRAMSNPCHVEKAIADHGGDTRAILVELGQRGMVGGRRT